MKTQVRRVGETRIIPKDDGTIRKFGEFFMGLVRGPEYLGQGNATYVSKEERARVGESLQTLFAQSPEPKSGNELTREVSARVRRHKADAAHELRIDYNDEGQPTMITRITPDGPNLQLEEFSLNQTNEATVTNRLCQQVVENDTAGFGRIKLVDVAASQTRFANQEDMGQLAPEFALTFPEKAHFTIPLRRQA